MVGLGTSHSAIIVLRSVLRGRTATNPPAGRRRSFLNIPVHSPFGGIELRIIEAYMKTTGEPVPTSVGVFYIALVLVLSYAKKI